MCGCWHCLCFCFVPPPSPNCPFFFFLSKPSWRLPMIWAEAVLRHLELVSFLLSTLILCVGWGITFKVQPDLKSASAFLPTGSSLCSFPVSHAGVKSFLWLSFLGPACYISPLTGVRIATSDSVNRESSLFVSCWICCGAWVFTFYRKLSLSKQQNWWFSLSALPFSNSCADWAGLAGATPDKKSTNPGISCL